MKKLIALFLLIAMFSSCVVMVPRNLGFGSKLHHRYERYYAPSYRNEPRMRHW